MKKITTTLAALTAALSLSTFVPAADAGPRHQMHGNNFHGHNGAYHRGRGRWHNGKWIALGVGAAIVGAAAANSGDCYWRHGRRYCD